MKVRKVITPELIRTGFRKTSMASSSTAHVPSSYPAEVPTSPIMASSSDISSEDEDEDDLEDSDFVLESEDSDEPEAMPELMDMDEGEHLTLSQEASRAMSENTSSANNGFTNEQSASSRGISSSELIAMGVESQDRSEQFDSLEEQHPLPYRTRAASVARSVSAVLSENTGLATVSFAAKMLLYKMPWQAHKQVSVLQTHIALWRNVRRAIFVPRWQT